jgi:hypothetical protein
MISFLLIRPHPTMPRLLLILSLALPFPFSVDDDWWCLHPSIPKIDSQKFHADLAREENEGVNKRETFIHSLRDHASSLIFYFLILSLSRSFSPTFIFTPFASIFSPVLPSHTSLSYTTNRQAERRILVPEPKLRKEQRPIHVSKKLDEYVVQWI